MIKEEKEEEELKSVCDGEQGNKVESKGRKKDDKRGGRIERRLRWRIRKESGKGESREG